MTTTWNPRPVTRHELLALAASTLALVGGTLIVALLFVALTRLAGITTPPWLGVLMALAGYGAQILVLGALLRRLRWTWNDLGFNRLGRRGWHLVWQIPLSLVLTLLLTLLVAGLVPGLTPDDTSAADGQVLSSAVPWQLAFLLVYLLVGPFIEEIAFRRLLMAWFDRHLGVLVSTILTSVVFGLVHLAPAVIVSTGIGGVCMALLTRWHRSVWGGYSLHMANNTLASAGIIAAMLVS